jgi:hypothetical protein
MRRYEKQINEFMFTVLIQVSEENLMRIFRPEREKGRGE